MPNKLSATIAIIFLSLLLLCPLMTVSAKNVVSVTGLTTFGGTNSFAGDINDRGQVVGSWSGTTGSHAFVWTAKDGKTDLAEVDDQLSGSATSINDNGQIVGSVSLPNPDYVPPPPTPPPPMYLPHAVLWTAKNTAILLEPPLEVEASIATDINNKGQVVGYTMQVIPPDPPDRPSYYTSPDFAFIWTAKTGMTKIPLDYPEGVIASIASGINNNGQVVGALMKDDGKGVPITYCAFIWSAKDGTQLIPMPATATLSTASDINNKGQVIGSWAEDPTLTRHGFVWTAKDGMKEIPVLPGGEYSIPIDINENGQIVGVCSKTGASGQPPAFQRGFLWDPKKGIMELPPLAGYTHSLARGINNNGLVAGQSTRYEYVPPSPPYSGYYISTSEAVVWDTRGIKP